MSEPRATSCGGRLVGKCMFCGGSFFTFEYAVQKMKDNIERGMCHECLNKLNAAAVARHIRQHFHYELPCIVCEELYSVSFDERASFGRMGECTGTLKPWLCPDCETLAAEHRASKRARASQLSDTTDDAPKE